MSTDSLGLRLSYAQQVQHPQWQRHSAQIKERAGYKCEECESGEKRLTVHHIYYLSGKLLWEHPDALLVCLCWDCHRERQSIEQALYVNLATILRDLRIAELKEQPLWTFFSEEASARR